MTREEILNLTERQLDVAIAEHIFGWTEIKYEHIRGVDCPGRDEPVGFTQNSKKSVVPWYSQSIADAWQVLLHITKPLKEFISDDGVEYSPDNWTLDRLGYDCCGDGADPDGVHGEWRIYLSCDKSEDHKDSIFETGETAPIAICRAALMVKFPEKENE